MLVNHFENGGASEKKKRGESETSVLHTRAGRNAHYLESLNEMGFDASTETPAPECGGNERGALPEPPTFDPLPLELEVPSTLPSPPAPPPTPWLETLTAPRGHVMLRLLCTRATSSENCAERLKVGGGGGAEDEEWEVEGGRALTAVPTRAKENHNENKKTRLLRFECC